jgi:outer membrane receptor protein involved in Fe transport
MASKPKLTHAIHLALVSSATAAAALHAPAAISQDQELSEIVVTGSRIRRVEAETASPVFVMDREAIEASGVTTMGQLMQRVPSVSGAATNTAVNNGGGDGASTIELRGLSDERTLVLLNGRRVIGIAGTSGATGGAVDINQFPVNLIERVDVLKEGAGAIYGSDAIGGVVNFVTRTDFDGVELGYDYGQSGEGDGERSNVSIAWGTEGERGSVVISASYNEQEEISANDRDFSRNALYLYGGVVTAGGSSRAPGGRIRFAGLSPESQALQDFYNCDSNSVTLIEGRPGDSLDDYRCFITSGGNVDFYNYQPLNLLITPQERANFFTSANYDMAEGVELYAEMLHSITNSGYQIAELPFDARDDDIVIPANNYYNPFGIAFGGVDGINDDAEWRVQSLGTRHNSVETAQTHAVLGFRGLIGDTGWDWDFSGGYSRADQDNATDGYLLSSRLKDAFGPSFLDPVSGEVVCGTPGNVISGCTPVNPFDINNPNQADELSTIAASYNQNTVASIKSFAVGLTGEAFDMPAGALQLATGASYEEYDFKFDTDSLTETLPPDNLNCGLAQETCSSDSRGGYEVSSIYGEALVPILSELPGAYALNLILGLRYSNYDLFDDSTDGSVKLEWRPVEDLLIRGSWSEAFRVPQIGDLFGGKFANAPTFNDPCVGITAADVADNPNLADACVNVPVDGSFAQPNSQVTGRYGGNRRLQPETGEVLTAGFVYQPSFIGGLTLTVDFWDYELENVITSLDVNSTAEICVNSGTSAVVDSLPGSPSFCSLINRNPDGTIFFIDQPTLNFGTLETSGYDVGIEYALNDTPAGSFLFALDTTFIDKYDSTPCAVCATTEVAGTFDRQFGNYADWRALASLGWRRNDFSATLSGRYVDGVVVHDADGLPGIQGDLNVPSVTYLDMSLGYTFREKLTVQLGADNLTDEQPPLLYQNNVINANTDVSTYDTVGRFYRASLQYKF